MNTLSDTLDDFLDRRGAVRTQAESLLRAADANELFDLGLPLLTELKGARVEHLFRLLRDRAPDADPERLSEQLIAATQVKCVRQNYWSPELAVLLENVASQDRVVEHCMRELFAKESKVPVLRRGLAAQTLGKAATPLALRALATRARLDRERPAENWRTPLPGQAKLPKLAPWRARVVYGLTQFGSQALASILLEVASPWPEADWQCWRALVVELQGEALPWLVQRYQREPSMAIRFMADFDHPDVHQWLRCLTASRDVDICKAAVDALAGLDREAAVPWRIGFLEAKMSGILTDEKRHAWVLKQLGDVPYQPGRRGGLDGETCPFELHDRDERPEHLELTEAQRAELEAQEAPLIFSAAELKALTA